MTRRRPFEYLIAVAFWIVLFFFALSMWVGAFVIVKAIGGAL